MRFQVDIGCHVTAAGRLPIHRDIFEANTRRRRGLPGLARVILVILPLLPALLSGRCMAEPSKKPSAVPDFLVTPDSTWRYKSGGIRDARKWYLPKFDDSRWQQGKAGFGYADNDDRTVLPGMRGKDQAVRIRQTFEVASPSLVGKLYLYVLFDDGFVAYLNGKEIARSHVVDKWFSREIESHEAIRFERFAVHDAAGLLQTGTNVLAVVGFNRSIDSSDFSLHPVLTTKRTRNPGLSLSLSDNQIREDLDFLEKRLEDQSSYLSLRPDFDHVSALDSLRSRAAQQLTAVGLAREVAKLLAQMGDAHAEVKAWLDNPSDRFLPFRLADTSSGIIALDPSGDALLDDDFPHLVAIDDVPLEKWLETAARFVPYASPQLIRRESLRELRSIDRMRSEMSRPTLPQLKITLASPDGKERISKRLDTSNKRLSSGKMELGKSRILDDNIGYLRIPSMPPYGARIVIEDMAKLADTDGLIIDVRGNRGGYYPILQSLYGYFMKDGDSPYVANIAAYRLSERFRHDHLHDRRTYRADYAGWTTAERRSVADALARFRPEWQPPAGLFSDWHFMILNRSADRRQFEYSKPVAVLTDSGSYSATDVFLSAFADLPGAVLIGGPSSGGSGATKGFMLPHSGIRIALSSMASYRPDGRLFDGRGIKPDLVAYPTVDDMLGRSDSVLQLAIDWHKKRKN